MRYTSSNSSHKSPEWSHTKIRLHPTLSLSGNNSLYSDGPLLFPSLFAYLPTFNLEYPCRVNICLTVKQVLKVLEFSLAFLFRPTKPEKPTSCCILCRLQGNCIISHSLRLNPKCMALNGLSVPPRVACCTVIHSTGVLCGDVQPRTRVSTMQLSYKLLGLGIQRTFSPTQTWVHTFLSSHWKLPKGKGQSYNPRT